MAEVRDRLPTRLRALGATAVLAVAIATTAGCGGESEDRRRCFPDDVIDEQLMAVLLQARDQHHLADIYIADGDVEAAIVAVRQIVALPFPVGTVEGQDVLLDARARLGKLLLGHGEPVEALRVVEEGIAAAVRESYFLANLHTVRAQILRSRAAEAESQEEAWRSRREAVEALSLSYEMAERVQRRLWQQQRRRRRR
jgi:hypothetical protein